MVAALAGEPTIQIPISGIGGIQTWQDAAEFFLLGASTVQVCTAVMHYGFRIVEHLQSGLENWMRQKGFARLDDFVGRSTERVKTWGELDLNYKVVARIDQAKCIHCGLCYIACEDGCHQSIHWEHVPVADFLLGDGQAGGSFRSGNVQVVPGAGDGTVNRFTVREDVCVGCNMCSLVCPVEGCIAMVEVDTGKPAMSWNEYQAKLAAGQIAAIRPPEHL
jgi:dihydropyrimidine dehydrogenase (NAD+) subunit PreA